MSCTMKTEAPEDAGMALGHRQGPGEWSPFFFQVKDEGAQHRERGVSGPGMGKIQGRLCRTQKISARMGPYDNK